MDMLDNTIFEIKSLQMRQQNWLYTCLRRNAETVIGRQYDFSSIDSIEEFQRRVPLQDYEAYRSYIDRMFMGESDVLFSGDPVAFECTSGSLNKSKLIPYSAHSLEDFQNAIIPWLKDLIERFDLSNGCTYWSLSPVTREAKHTPSGIPVGLPDSAYLGDAAGFMSNISFAVPSWVVEIDNIYDWQLYTLYWLLSNKDLLFISVWSPSFLTVMLDSINEHSDALKRLFSDGGVYKEHVLPRNLAASKRLHAFLQNKDYRTLWPDLKLVSCWGDASSVLFYDELKSRFPYVTFQPKGLLSTEAVVTFPDSSDMPVLAADSGFYEFVDETGVYLAHELSPSKVYEVVVSTSGGLYRYRTSDLVCCETYKNGLPVLRFTGRSGIQSDLVGEKLTDAFVTSCLRFIPGFSMLVPARCGKSSYYRLVLDKKLCEHVKETTIQVDQNLMQNPHYAYARKLHQLAPVQPVCMNSPVNKYLDCMTQSGMRYGDIKIPALCNHNDWLAVIDGAIQ